MGRIEDLGLVADKGLEWKARAESAEKELAAAKEQLEFDRTTCHNFLKALDKALDGRFWLTEGRGSYSWDDDRYRSEFHDATVALRAILDPMRKMAQNLSSRLPTTEDVVNARIDLKAKADAALLRATQAEQELKDLKEWWNLNPKLFQHKLAELTLQSTRMRAAGEALVLRWDSPGWKDVPHTAVFIEALRAVIAETPAQSLAKHDAEVLRKAAEHCEETELLMPVPQPGTTLRLHGANVCHALAAELRAKAHQLEQQAAGGEAEK